MLRFYNHQIIPSPNFQFPEVQMTEQNICLESTGLEVVSHILARRRDDQTWKPMVYGHFERFFARLEKIVHFFTLGEWCHIFHAPCWNEINSKWETQSQASWQVQPWSYSSTSFLGSWALLRCSVLRSNFVCWKSSLKIHPPFFPPISSSLFCFVCFRVSTWHETSEPFWALRNRWKFFHLAMWQLHSKTWLELIRGAS